MKTKNKARASKTKRWSAHVTKTSHAVIAATLVIQLGVRTVVRFFDQAEIHHALDRLVQCSGSQHHFALGLLFHFFHDAVAMALLVHQGEKDVEDRGGQRQKIVWGS